MRPTVRLRIGALRITYTILGPPYYKYTYYRVAQYPILIIQAPELNGFRGLHPVTRRHEALKLPREETLSALM